MHEALIDQLRGVVIAVGAGIGFDRSAHVLAQSVPAISDATLMQLAEKGGGWVVLLIVLFFYRRDYQRLTSAENATSERLMNAIAKQAESEQSLAVALTENTEVMRRMIALEEDRHR